MWESGVMCVSFGYTDRGYCRTSRPETATPPSPLVLPLHSSPYYPLPFDCNLPANSPVSQCEISPKLPSQAPLSPPAASQTSAKPSLFPSTGPSEGNIHTEGRERALFPSILPRPQVLLYYLLPILRTLCRFVAIHIRAISACFADTASDDISRN